MNKDIHQIAVCSLYNGLGTHCRLLYFTKQRIAYTHDIWPITVLFVLCWSLCMKSIDLV